MIRSTSSHHLGAFMTPAKMERRRSSFAPSSAPTVQRRSSLSPETSRRESNAASTSSKRRSMSSTSITSAKSARRSSVSTFRSNMTGSEFDDGEDADLDDIEEWEGEGSEYTARPRKKRKRDEPMSPLAVVLYVIFFYIIWQILTRSDEHEIFAGLSPSSILSHSLPEHSGLGYHMPYHLPHIPSPIPPASANGEGSTSMWRIALGVAVYPIYLAITLLAIPLPFLLNALHLVWDILTTVLYPVTATVSILTRTFVFAPFGLVRTIMSAFYPVYVFVGSVIGVGCVLGMGAGWAGRKLLDRVLGRKKTSKSRSGRSKSRSSASGRSRTSRTTRSERSALPPRQERLVEVESSGESPEKLKTPLSRVNTLFEDQQPVEIVQERMAGFSGTRGGKKRMTSFSDEVRGGYARGSSRDPLVVGIRKRGMRGDEVWE